VESYRRRWKDIVVTGVAGAGKTTIGTMLAAALGCEYVEGDSLHAVRNARVEPLLLR
jgi:gluconokinase